MRGISCGLLSLDRLADIATTLAFFTVVPCLAAAEI
jgi:hypothetical protein